MEEIRSLLDACSRACTYIDVLLEVELEWRETEVGLDRLERCLQAYGWKDFSLKKSRG